MIRWRFVSLFMVAALLAMALASMQSLHFLWRGGYTGLGQVSPISDLVRYQAITVAGEIRQFFTSTDEPGLPPVSIFVGAQERSKLMESLPENVKDWQPAYLIYPDDELKKVKIRHRGDNPVNWMVNKKSWYLKTKKKRLIDGVRRFIYPSPQEADFVSNYLAYRVAHQIGVLAPEARLVELSINDEPHGIYAEIEDIEESFLRNHGIMPVNIFKGEQYNSERLIYASNYLFNNPNLWDKEAMFNREPKESRTDFSIFLKTLLQARTSDAALDKLTEIARYDDWARFAAYQTLVHSWHNSSVHNQRIVSDPWRGIVMPIVHDTVAGFPRPPFSFKSVGASNEVLNDYSLIPSFLARKYDFLWQFLEQHALDEVADELTTTVPKMAATYARDTYALETAALNGTPLSTASRDGMVQEWQDLATRMKAWGGFLRQNLSAPAEATWYGENNRLYITVAGPRPSGELELRLGDAGPLPTRIIWDRDRDGVISKTDLDIPFTIDGRILRLKTNLFANRVVRSAGENPSDISDGEIAMIPTTFTFLADKELNPAEVLAVNPFTQKLGTLEMAPPSGIRPRDRNAPLVNKQFDTPRLWSGSIHITKDRIVREPVRIAPGTEIRIANGRSLVFLRRLEALGSAEQPIVVKPDNDDAVWGAFSITGPLASNSVLEHLEVFGGSEAVVDGVYYSGMINIHEGSGHRLRALHARKNLISDDLIHIVYATDTVINDCQLSEARSDAIDIDISEVIVNGCDIVAAGNDGIDLMSSKVLIVNGRIDGSGDKGVSVGEASETLIENMVLARNAIGIEVKDGSRAFVDRVDFDRNTKHLNGYWKNWRYDSGGHMLVIDSRFSGTGLLANAEDGSSIAIQGSSLPQSPKLEGKQIYLDREAIKRAGDSELLEMQLRLPQVLDYWHGKDPGMRMVN